ncbi:MAG TPA: ABC transporter substrate-binding protein [Thermotogota bacterium]|nr:ABC transporter substrate-binding protein [Thermotogota bacterium]HPJ88987.1 ABC transporter substrate-binding protein [Thermotogota bacterium]HPR97268.1 ABC transporter substrate-binding protein [Thermotogota bacterium]
MRRYLIAIGILSLLVGLFFIISCQEDGEIKIGVSVSLTGADSLFGISIRNGVEYAVDEINSNGGVNGKMIRLLVKDDQNNKDKAIEDDSELIDKGVCAIIGHVSSSITKAVLPLMTEKKMLLLSPTVSSNDIILENEMLISLGSSNRIIQKTLADYMTEQDKIKRLAIIYDANNQEYSNYWLEVIRSYLSGTDVQIVDVLSFDSSVVYTDFYLLALNLISKKPDGVLMIATSLHTASLSQQLYKIDPNIKKYTTTWAFDNMLIENGGESVESLVLTTPYDRYSEDSVYLSFKEGFTKRYGTEPEFSSAYAYETTSVLYQALLKVPDCDPEKIRDEILSIGSFKGLSAKIEINPSGLSSREAFLYIIENSKYKKIPIE